MLYHSTGRARFFSYSPCQTIVCVVGNISGEESPGMGHSYPGNSGPLSLLRPLVVVTLILIPVILTYSRFVYHILRKPPIE